MTSRLFPAWLPVVFIGLLHVAGCASKQQREGYGVSATQFQDMVVPDGFRLRDDAHESYAREEGGWRHGHFVYSSNGDLEPALNYVRQNMPRHRWQIMKDDVVEGAVHLRFERGAYSADYTFIRREGATQMVVEYSTDYSRR